MTAAARMKSALESEVCVLGGGPAGSVIARRLAELGHDVVLVERGAVGPRQERKARAESLAPSILPILDSVRLRDIVESSAFIREERSLVLWGSGDVEVKSWDAAPSLLVERASLDDRLRAAASDTGTRVVALATARAARREACGEWLVPVVASAGPLMIKARFLVDARGKRRHPCIDDGVPTTVAMSAPWLPCGGCYAETRIEAGRDEWVWGNPLPDGSYAATIFVDSARVAGLRSHGRAALCRDILSRSKLLGGLSKRRMIGPVDVRDATPRVNRDPIGHDFIRVGEAAVAIDPLSSQGIQTALLSAIQGAAAVHTILTAGCDLEPALAFYRERARTTAARSRAAAARFYREHPAETPFWMRRSFAAGSAAPEDRQQARPIPELPSRLGVARSLRIVDIPVLSGAFIRRARALHHAGLEEPVAYLGGMALAPLVLDMPGPSTPDEIMRRWSALMPAQSAWNIMNWMFEAGILVPHPGEREAASARPSPSRELNSDPGRFSLPPDRSP
jgi:2-polyprenyl-6-methoxyphenol hydroxylase-like FAD-dependent oxidoreductase